MKLILLKIIFVFETEMVLRSLTFKALIRKSSEPEKFSINIQPRCRPNPILWLKGLKLQKKLEEFKNYPLEYHFH